MTAPPLLITQHGPVYDALTVEARGRGMVADLLRYGWRPESASRHGGRDLMVWLRGAERQSDEAAV